MSASLSVMVLVSLVSPYTSRGQNDRNFTQSSTERAATIWPQKQLQNLINTKVQKGWGFFFVFFFFFSFVFKDKILDSVDAFLTHSVEYFVNVTPKLYLEYKLCPLLGRPD